MHDYTVPESKIYKARKDFDNMSATKQHDSLKRKQKYYENMRWVIARLIECNHDDNSKFITLTFKDNIQDIEYTNNELKKFIKRLNYKLYKTKKQVIKYLATWEKQERGAIHYHILFFSFPYIKNNELADIWGHGFIKINKIEVDSKDNIGRYISKYFSKDLDLKEHKKKAFFKSQNLQVPREEKVKLTDEMLSELEKEQLVFTKSYKRDLHHDEDGVISSNVVYMKFKK